MRLRADEDDLYLVFHGSMGIATGAVVAEFISPKAAAALAVFGLVSFILVREFGEVKVPESEGNA